MTAVGSVHILCKFHTSCERNAFKMSFPRLLERPKKLWSSQFCLADRCELDARDDVEKIQMLFIEALQYLLNKRVKSESGLHFSKILNVFLKLREMNEEFLKFYKQMCEDPMIQQHMPELLHFLIDWLPVVCVH